MITQLRGRLLEKNPTHIVVDCNGIGYEVNISLHTFSRLKGEEQITIYTHLQVKEDSHTLYGFMEKAERLVFRQLLSVSGIGANTARMMLSSLTPEQVVEAISTEDTDTIQSVKGIGKKTAQRVILDLKDKIRSSEEYSEIVNSPSNSNKEEALSALETLGYTRKQSGKIISKICNNNPDANVEDIIKLALKNL
ncbi:Holliday junction DNA helicase RuvA [Psychroflexus gondwanensis ACAM 44]|jgi:Holliday junction DNA helicase RuvA|uniref:Holliday junction branch migration complex subunit RuvA n=1 Tax=Psychroflexus gondwanensis ACAM 44 TaxID=1189619 RepID=N1WVM5_9FLAO|nr:Holliday junction branch migration protein RuvA [Psychroflexus gondwanensis]EMY81262.1 Holliday junction DNA helicase RuvA [Psychroflexus gondwanensis ACAM 44]